MKKLKTNQKGITLIALIITIIVLLILAGISLNLVMGDGGILTRATNARKTTDIAGAQEKVELLAADYSLEYLQQRYVNRDTSVAENAGAHVANELSKKSSVDGYSLETSRTTVKLSGDGATVTGRIGEGGEITWNSIDTSVATVAVTAETAVGDPVEYNIPYTDVYTGTEYTKDDGWLFLSKTEEPAESGKYTVKLMSAGIPAKLSMVRIRNGYMPYNWLGTDEQVRNLYGDVAVSEGYLGFFNCYAAAGLEKNFENIVYYREYDGNPAHGWYSCVNGVSSGELTGAEFKIAGSNVCVHNMTFSEAYSLSVEFRGVDCGGWWYWLSNPYPFYMLPTSDPYAMDVRKKYVSLVNGSGSIDSTEGLEGRD